MSTTLGRAALVVSGGILASRLLGFLRDVVLAALLGRGIEADLYRAAFAIPDFLYFLMAGGYLTITFVPIVSRYLASDDNDGANRSFTAVFRILAVLMVVTTGLVMILAGWLTPLVFPEIPADRIPELTTLVRIVLPAQVFFVLGSLFMAIQYAHRRFVIPTLAPVIYNLAIISGGLISAAVGSVSPEAFIWGALAGSALGNFAVQWWGARRVGARFVSGVPLVHETIPEYFTLAFPLMIGQSAVALDEVFVSVFGQLGGVGDISGLGYARRINMLPVGVIAQAAGVASYPFLARLFAAGRIGELRETVARALRSSLTVAGLAAAGAIGLALPGIRLAYQRGAWNPDDTVAVASLLAIYGISIPLWAAHQVYTRGFYAQRRMWLPVGIGTTTTVLAIPIYYFGATILGASGVALASVAVMLIYTIAIGWFWHRSAPFREVGTTLARMVAAAVPAGAVAWATVQLLADGNEMTTVAAVTALAVGGVAAVTIYLGALALMRAPELSLLTRRIRAGRPDARGTPDR